MNKFFKQVVWLIIFAPVVYLAIAWKKLPENIALHFDIQGNPDRFGDRNELLTWVILLTGINIIVYLSMINIYRVDPKKYAAENKDRLQRIGFAIVLFMAALLFLIIHSSTSASVKLNMGFVFSGIGLLFAIIGNYMPNLKPNYFAGLRLPWTLENPENWKKTHQLAGKLWFAGGLSLAVICLFLPAAVAIPVFFCVVVIITAIPCVYSYMLYKKQKAGIDI